MAPSAPSSDYALDSLLPNHVFLSNPTPDLPAAPAPIADLPPYVIQYYTRPLSPYRSPYGAIIADTKIASSTTASSPPSADDTKETPPSSPLSPSQLQPSRTKKRKADDTNELRGNPKVVRTTEILADEIYSQPYNSPAPQPISKFSEQERVSLESNLASPTCFDMLWIANRFLYCSLSCAIKLPFTPPSNHGPHMGTVLSSRSAPHVTIAHAFNVSSTIVTDISISLTFCRAWPSTNSGSYEAPNYTTTGS